MVFLITSITNSTFNFTRYFTITFFTNPFCWFSTEISQNIFYIGIVSWCTDFLTSLSHQVHLTKQCHKSDELHLLHILYVHTLSYTFNNILFRNVQFSLYFNLSKSIVKLWSKLFWQDTHTHILWSCFNTTLPQFVMTLFTYSIRFSIYTT